MFEEKIPGLSVIEHVTVSKNRIRKVEGVYVNRAHHFFVMSK